MSKIHGYSSASNQAKGAGLVDCYTLVDITRTGVVAYYKEGMPMFLDDADQIINDEVAWTRSRNQQRNYETLIQVISLRGQPVYLEDPKRLRKQNLSLYEFADKESIQDVWRFSFSAEQPDVYRQGNNPVAALEQDSQNIPIILGLHETASIDIPMLQLGINTYFKVRT